MNYRKTIFFALFVSSMVSIHLVAISNVYADSPNELEVQSGADSELDSNPQLYQAKLAKLINQLAAKKRKTIKNAIISLGKVGDPAALPALIALQNRKLYRNDQGQSVIETDNGWLIAASQAPYDPDKSQLSSPRINNSVRRQLKSVIPILQLKSDAAEIRKQAATDLSAAMKPEFAAAVRQAMATESEASIKAQLRYALARVDIASGDKALRLDAINFMGQSKNIAFKITLNELLEQDDQGRYLEQDFEIRAAARKALKKIKSRETLINQTSNFLYGLSLGSVLLLAALGLAITFGLMGVINMAHGEMLMLGAYSTYVVQNIFASYLPGMFQWYLVFAIPVAFLIPALVGVVLERSVIRHLYGRPLETLLATWGISLVLIQTVRLIFGAQNVSVENPVWISGGIELFPNVVFPYNRIVTILFAIFVVVLVYFIFQRTRVGLQVRAVSQNRAMASCMGIDTNRVDMLTFGLGSGIAGLGGVVLSQLGNVGPELGQGYIVDSFMVVVLGGVGKIIGTVVGAMGLGMLNKFLEPEMGAVLGKIMVLVLIILFIQRRPQGIFAQTGRAADD